MTPEGVDAHFRAVEEAVHVETVPDAMRSRSTELFVHGAAKLGIPMKAIRRNTQGCRGESRCNFGCPHGAKMSVDFSYLPDACDRGALIVSDALVERVDVTGGVGARRARSPARRERRTGRAVRGAREGRRRRVRLAAHAAAPSRAAAWAPGTSGGT